MFPLAKLQFEIEMLDANAPLGYWGVRLRGGYGEALKESLCDCSQRNDSGGNKKKHGEGSDSYSHFNFCEFPILFKPRIEHFQNQISGKPLGIMANLPPPFVIDPPPEVDSNLCRGSRLSFGFTAFGPTIKNILRVIEAFGQLGSQGINNNSQKARYQLLDVRDLLAAGRSLHVMGNFGQSSVRDASALVREMSPQHLPDEAVISFVTPVRILHRSFPPLAKDASRKQALQPKGFRDFYEFMQLLTDRVAGLWQLYGNTWIGQAEYFRWRNRLLKDSKAIKAYIELDRKNYTRIPSEQQRPIEMDGFVGAMHITGNLQPFIELLLLGEMVHLGEATPYGFGQYKLVY